MIDFNFSINATPETIYSALATQAGINGWWSKDCDIAASTGGTSTMRFIKEDRPVTMVFRVEELSPNRVAWTCTNNDNPAWIDTTLVFDFKADGEGSAFTFRHGNFAEQWLNTPPYTMTAEGWQHFMNSLKAYCESGTGQPW